MTGRHTSRRTDCKVGRKTAQNKAGRSPFDAGGFPSVFFANRSPIPFLHRVSDETMSSYGLFSLSRANRVPFLFLMTVYAHDNRLRQP